MITLEYEDEKWLYNLNKLYIWKCQNNLIVLSSKKFYLVEIIRGVTIHQKYGSPRYEAGGSVHGPFFFLVISVRFTQKNFFEWQN